jgi:hypothetical protein
MLASLYSLRLAVLIGGLASPRVKSSWESGMLAAEKMTVQVSVPTASTPEPSATEPSEQPPPHNRHRNRRL